MGQIKGSRAYMENSLRNIEEKYGSNSEIAEFMREYDLVDGKSLVEYTKTEFKDKDLQNKKRGIIKLRGVVTRRTTIVVSQNYSYGHVVKILSEAPVMRICREMDGSNIVEFLIVDEKWIYASKVLR